MGSKRAVGSAVESFGAASAAIGPITAGMHRFLLTRGQFSMIDMIQHVLAEVGPASVSVWTWTIASYEVSAVESLIQDGRVRAASLVIDRSVDMRRPGPVRSWRERFGAGSVKICRNHAKIARVWTADRRVLIRGSMNLNFNPRFEQADVSEGCAGYDLVAGVEAALPVLEPGASNAEIDTASGLGRAFERSTLSMFHGLKTWAK